MTSTQSLRIVTLVQGKIFVSPWNYILGIKTGGGGGGVCFLGHISALNKFNKKNEFKAKQKCSLKQVLLP